MITALTMSMFPFSLRYALLVPAAIMLCTAILVVNRSSSRTNLMVGKVSVNFLANCSTGFVVFVSLLNASLGYPRTMHSTPSLGIYCVRNASNVCVGTVSNDDAMICNGSVTAIPVRFRPKSSASILGKSELEVS